jgi:uncharacterized membrane protein
VSVEAEVLLAILGMSLACYATRAGGFLLMGFMPIGRWVAAWLEEIPGAILTAIVAPAAIQGGLPYLAGLAATIVALRLVRHELASVVVGIATVAGMRALL